MGILADVLNFRGRSPSDDFWYSPVDAMTAAGVSISEDAAWNYTSVYACINLISKTLASLPCVTYERMEKGKRKATDHPLYPILRYRANENLSAFRFFQTMQGHVLTWGNAYAWKSFQPSSGILKGLYILPPDRMQVRQEGQQVYYYPNGLSGARYTSAQIMHVAGFGTDGVIGKSPIRLAREAIGLGVATEQFGARFFGNGSMPGGALIHPGKLTDDSKKALREGWERLHQGVGNSHRVAVLEQGVTWTQIGIPPEDAQFLETRKFQKREIASFYGVPPHMIGDLEDATNNNIEEQSIEFVLYSMQPWLSLWEQELQRNLHEADSQAFSEFLIANLMRGDSKARAEYYRAMNNIGAYSINDILELENMNPVENGDVHFVPLNMIALDDAVKLGKTVEGSGDKPEEEDALPMDVLRRAADMRTIVRRAFYPRFLAGAKKILRAEIRGVRKGLDHLRRRDSVSFRQYLDDFYREHRVWIQRQIGAIWSSYSAELVRVIELETGKNNLPVDPTFLDEFIATWITRHAVRSQKQLQKVADVPDPEAAAEEVEAVLRHWEETRAAQMARNDVVEGDGAFSLKAYRASGAAVKLWITSGKSNCGHCRTLNGTKVSIDEPFLEKGSELPAEGKQPIRIRGTKNHPPAHPNCDCSVAAI